MNAHRSFFSCALSALALGLLGGLPACNDSAEPTSGAAGQPAAAGSAGASSAGGSSGGQAAGGAAAGAAGMVASGAGGAAGAASAGGSTGGAGAASGGGSSAGASGSAAGGAGGSGGAGGGGGSAGAGTCGQAGAGGSAGAAYPRTGWTATYKCTGTCLAGNGDSPNDKPELAFDDNYQTRWSTNRYQQDLWNAQPTQFPLYYTVDMQSAKCVSKVTLHPSCRDYYDSAGAIDVLVSTDGQMFTSVVTNHVVAQPPGGDKCPPDASSKAVDVVTFPTVQARYIQIKATKSLKAQYPNAGDRYWAIGEFFAYP